MSTAIAIVYWYLIILASGLIGWRCLLRFDMDPGLAWAGGRIFGLALIVFIPWWLGWAGLEGWLHTGVLIFALAMVLAITDAIRHNRGWSSAVLPEAVFLIGFTAVMLIRLDRPEILHTEKFMDLGVLTSLLRTPEFPPPDFWLGGETMPYYYWGTLLWVVPLRLVEIDVGVGYNLIAATLGGLIAVLAWSIGCKLSGRFSGGAMAAILCVAAGTADGLRQLAATRNLAAVEIWQSSRQDANVITEFPLFTLWLGDLHPHLLSIPLVLLALLLALHFAQNGLTLVRLIVLAVVIGLVAAANPWAYTPTLVTVLLLLLFGNQKLCPGEGRWLDAVVIPLLLICGSWLTALPFHAYYSAPFQGLGWVHQGTSVPALLLYAGVLLVPVSGYALTRVHKPWCSPEAGYVVTLSGLALITLVASVSGRPAMVLLGALLIALVYVTTREPHGHDRSTAVLAVMGVFLLFAPEIVFVRDSYGAEFYRLNTVFKSYLQSWVMLSLAVPALLMKWLPRALPRRGFIAVLSMVAIVHPAALIVRFEPSNIGLDGLAWMNAGDRAIVDYLGTLQQDVVVLEATGEAYGESARISVASGIPAYLGWDNHEIVWRGTSVTPELERRAAAVARIYSGTDPKIIACQLQREGIDLVIIGPLELKQYPVQALRAIERAGHIVFEHRDTRVVRIP